MKRQWSKFSRGALALAVCGSFGCSRGSVSGDQCESGWILSAGVCHKVCVTDGDCGKLCTPADQDGEVCDEGLCVAGCSGLSPVIARIDGNGSPDGEALYSQNHIVNGLVIEGENFNDAEVSISEPSLAETMLVVDVGSATSTHLEVCLPDGLAAGAYTLTVTNQAGATCGDFELVRGEPGTAYTDADAVVAMGANAAANPLHHDRYTNAEAIAAAGPHYTDAEAIVAVGPHYTDAEAIVAVGPHYTDVDAVVAMGANAAANPLHHDRYTDAAAIAAVGPHTPDTTLTEAQVDAFANNNGYLTSYTETDPVFGASTAAGVTATDVSNWNVAFGYGDHGLVGYALTSDLTPHYTDAEAIVAVGPHYTDVDAVVAMGANAAANPLNHARYSDTEANTALSATVVALQARLDALEDSNCPLGYAHDTGRTDIVLCANGADEMVKVGDFWVDRYESSVWLNADCTGMQYGSGGDDYPGTFPDNGNIVTAADKLYACSVSGVTPSRSLTWFQAQQACSASSKHLITNAEWQAAAAGTYDPGSNDGSANTDCNTNSGGPRTTGSAGTQPATTCISTASRT